ncbi:MAG: hypothetical protein K0S10_2249, partial [Rubrobacteraceae bacterium]|nr:hypothetical protein [Rubrobacteraceae bacterium]
MPSSCASCSACAVRIIFTGRS